MYKHILIPTDGSEVADKAVTEGIEFAREAGAKITFFTAVPEWNVPGEADLMAKRVISPAEHAQLSREKAEALFMQPANRARVAGVSFETDYVENDFPWRAIIEAAQRHRCDAIFIGSHGRKGLSRLVHGSQTIDVLTHSDIPTLVYR